MLSVAFPLLALARAALADHWQPSAGTPWQIVLSENLQPPYPAGIAAIDGDMESNNVSAWTDLKSRGYETICYFSAGSYEDWRSDANEFNKTTDLGAPLDGWPGEWWLNTKSDNVRRIMKERMDKAVAKNCSAIDPDNVDAYADNNGGGLNLTTADAIDYVRFLATEAHARNMSIGLKNAGDIVPDVLNVTDFQVNEQCVEQQGCQDFRGYIDANKPVFNIEYTKKESTIPTRKEVDSICNNQASRGFSSVIKHMSLNAWVIECNITATNGTGNANMTDDATNSQTGAASSISTAGTTALIGAFLALLTLL